MTPEQYQDALAGLNIPSPDEIHPYAKAVMAKLANWDAGEGCYELYIPVPHKVEIVKSEVDLTGVDVALCHDVEAMLDVAQVLMGIEGLEYSTIGGDENTFGVDGLRY